MTQPQPYERQTDFTEFSAENPSTPQPGVALDGEFDAIKTTLEGALRVIALIQRDDGQLKNNIVTLDSLSPAVMLALGAGVAWLPRGAWITALPYAVSDVISHGTATYVCPVAHTAGVFTTDLAAGRWILIFDSAGTTPGDGTVTPAKLAPGSVTTPAIGFTDLDLAGRVRGQSGVQAGTAPAGQVLHAKLDTGSVLARVERKTDDQGAVGYRIVGVSVSWDLCMASAGEDLLIGPVGAQKTRLLEAGGLDQAGDIRATGTSAPTTGAGIRLYYAGGIGYADAYDHGGSAWKTAKIRGLEVYLTSAGIDVVKVTPTGVDITGKVQRGAVDLGWLDLPQNPQSASYTLTLGDRGKHIYSVNVAGQSVFVPTNSVAAFPIGSAIVIVNDGTNPITVSQGSVYLRLAGGGSTGDRSIASGGIATLLKVDTDRWFISGIGVS
jgi:hypothetical protein